MVTQVTQVACFADIALRAQALTSDDITQVSAHTAPGIAATGTCPTGTSRGTGVTHIPLLATLAPSSTVSLPTVTHHTPAHEATGVCKLVGDIRPTGTTTRQAIRGGGLLIVAISTAITVTTRCMVKTVATVSREWVALVGMPIAETLDAREELVLVIGRVPGETLGTGLTVLSPPAHGTPTALGGQ